MIIIRKDQFDALTAAWEQRRYAVLIARLRDEFPTQVGVISQEELEKEIEDGCKAAAALAISDTDHIYRFLRLRYLPASTWEPTGAHEMMVRILTDTSVDAHRRLQFTETNFT